MKSFSAKYFPDLNEFEQQYNDIWFNNMLNMLTEKGQIGVILCSLEKSVKYADSEYVAEVDTIFEELEGVVDKYYDKIEKAKSKQPTPDW